MVGKIVTGEVMIDDDDRTGRRALDLAQTFGGGLQLGIGAGVDDQDAVDGGPINGRRGLPALRLFPKVADIRLQRIVLR